MARATARIEARREEGGAPDPKGSQTYSSEKGSRTNSSESPGRQNAKRPGTDSPKHTKPSESESSSTSKDESPSKDAPAPETPEAKLSEAATALESGDFRRLARLLGKDEKIADEAGEKLSVIRRQRQRLTKREQAADKREAKLGTERMQLEQTYGDPVAAKKAYESGQYHVAAQYCQRIFGDDFAKITQNIARMTSGMSAEKLKELQERDNLERENRRLKAEREEAEKRSRTQATRSDALKVVSAKCDGHPVLKLKGGDDLVLRELEAHWDGKRITIGYKEAADAVLNRKKREAQELGFWRDEPAPTSEKKPVAAKKEPVKPTPRKESRASDVSSEKTTKDGRKAYRSLEERIAAANRRTERLRGG